MCQCMALTLSVSRKCSPLLEDGSHLLPVVSTRLILTPARVQTWSHVILAVPSNQSYPNLKLKDWLTWKLLKAPKTLVYVRNIVIHVEPPNAFKKKNSHLDNWLLVLFISKKTILILSPISVRVVTKTNHVLELNLQLLQIFSTNMSDQ